MSRPFIYRLFLLAFLFSICLTSAGQAYTESELNNRINEIANGISDVTDMNQVSDFFNLMGFSISIYQSNLGTPLAEQYVNQILFNSYCTSDELKGMISFLKKYMRGKTNYSENEKASFHAAVLIYAREVALSESELREKKFREEEKKKKADLENDNCLKQTVLEFIDYYCNLAHEDVYNKCFKTLQKFDVDPSRIIRHDNNETRSLEMNVRHYARSFEQRNPDIDSLITSTDFSFSDIGSFASYVRSTPDSNLKLVVAAYKSFISSKYFQLLKISCLWEIANRCDELLELLANRETRTDNHTVNWEVHPRYNWVYNYQIDYVYNDGVFVPDGNIIIHTNVPQNPNHSGDCFIERTFDVTYEGFIKDGVLTEITATGKIQEWTRNLSAGEGYEPYTAVMRINNAPAKIKNEIIIKSIKDIIGNDFSAFEVLEFLNQDRYDYDTMIYTAKNFAKDPESFMYDYLNGYIHAGDYLKVINQPYCHNVDYSICFQ